MRTDLRQMAFIAVLVGVPVASYFTVFKPQNAEIARAKAEIELKQSRLERLREATRMSDGLERANSEIRRAIDAIESRLPSDKEMDSVLRDVALIAAKCGLKLPTFKRADKALPAGTALEQPIEMSITGDFDGFYRFLLEVEKLPRVTRLTDMKLTRSNDVDGNMQCSCTMSIYYQGASLAGVQQ
ncbi:MAG: type 4a pilus biogenesis protein PilO [Phycisphaeraceae bacterium]|nr:type 4a pilus biogenesis protein PilO [Phycisphaeraceae bacterium]